MSNYTTTTKIRTVFKCKTGHLVAGIVILKAGEGYICPYCGTDIRDVTKEEDGQSYFQLTRSDLYSPAPLRTPS